MNLGDVAALNETARSVVAGLKAGTTVRGTVCAPSDGRTWVAVEFPGIGWRRLAVDSNSVAPGQEVVVECVPNPYRPGAYLFRIAK